MGEKREDERQMRDDERQRSKPRAASAAEESDTEQSASRGENDDEVRRRAYERFLSRGDGAGSDVDDWLEAEREMRGERQDGGGGRAG